MLSFKAPRPVMRVLLLLTLALAACQPTASTGSVAPGASDSGEKPTGRLTILMTPQEDFCRAIAEAFEKETGIKTSFIRMSSGEALARLRAGKDSPEFSVWWGGPADGYIAAANENLLQKYVPPTAAKIPANYKDSDGIWHGIYAGTLGFASNTKLLAEKNLKAPESWADLLKPEFRNQVAMAHPGLSGTAYTALATQMMLNGKNEDKGMAYFRELHRNIVQYSKTGAAPVQVVGRGEAMVGIVFSHDTIAGIEEGYPLKLTFPSEGTGYEIGGVALIKGAKEPVEAKRFIEWSLTATAQNIGPTVKAYQLPTSPDAKVSDKAIPLNQVKTVAYDFQWAGDRKKDLVEKFQTDVAPQPK